MVLRFLSLAFGSRQRPVRDASCCLATASSVRDRKLFLSQGVPGISKPGAEENVPGSALPHDAFCGEAITDSAGLPHAATQIVSAGDHAEGLGDYCGRRSGFPGPERLTTKQLSAS